MIKSVHRLYVAKDERQFQALTELFDALGLAAGESWKGRRSSGMKFEAAEAGVEIGVGADFPNADLVIEVDSADIAHEIVAARKFEIVEPIADHDWGARIFAFKLPGGAGRVSVFSYNENWRQNQPGAGALDGRGKQFAIVVSRFNAFVTERLLSGAMDALQRTGVARGDIHAVRVPGSYEVPVMARQLASSGKYDAVICLGCLIRGETLHYEVIANEVARGIGQSAQETGVPHAFGVLTCDTLEQALDRAGLKSGNKGFEAGLSAVEMANLGAAENKNHRKATKAAKKRNSEAASRAGSQQSTPRSKTARKPRASKKGSRS
jgi:6,7-dimethyl-8-ribityllumazine synthase